MRVTATVNRHLLHFVQLKTGVIIVPLLLLAAPFAASDCDFVSGPGNVQTAVDCDYKGNDIKSVICDSLLCCAVACELFQGCTHFTWVQDNNHCWLKLGDLAGRRPSPGDIAGHKIPWEGSQKTTKQGEFAAYLISAL